MFIPTAKKALLRSPEIAVHGVRHFLEHLRVNLDETAVDFFKTTASTLLNWSLQDTAKAMLKIAFRLHNKFRRVRASRSSPVLGTRR